MRKPAEEESMETECSAQRIVSEQQSNLLNIRGGEPNCECNGLAQAPDVKQKAMMQDERVEQVVAVRVKASEQHQGLGHSAAGRRNARPVAQKTRSKSLPTPTIGTQNWYQDILLSTLFRACIKLQTKMDQRFRKTRMTAQQAAVLVHCVDSRLTSPGALATAIGRDKGMVTRFIQRLVARGLLKREAKPQDRRVAQLRPTSRGRAMAPQLKLAFTEIRERLFKGILAKDIERVGKLLTIMLTNMDRNGFGSVRKRSRQKPPLAGVADAPNNRVPSGILK
jgi:DNA-binding MarR family transcriptional regulator